jgi:glycosyltransferase involved in cell wall biosynthesis
MRKGTTFDLPNAIASLPFKPLVSILIPYYNHSAFVVEAVLSIKRQAYPNIEIILVDDGSVVPAETLLQEFKDVVVLRTDNRGVSAARNTAFRRSSGDFLIFLDADDRLVSGAIEAHLMALQQKQEAGFSFGATRIIDGFGEVVRAAHICRPRKNYFLMFLESNPVGSPGAAMIRREAFESAGLFNEAFSMGEDLDLYLRIARRRPVVRHTFCVLEYREHNANTSRAQERMLAGTMALLDNIESVLTNSERRRLPHARSRWEHVFRHNTSFRYRVWGLYYSFRAMLSVPLRSYFER